MRKYLQYFSLLIVLLSFSTKASAQIIDVTAPPCDRITTANFSFRSPIINYICDSTPSLAKIEMTLNATLINQEDYFLLNPRIIIEVQGRGDCWDPNGTNPSYNRDFHRFEFPLTVANGYRLNNEKLLLEYGTSGGDYISSKCFQWRIGIATNSCELFKPWRFEGFIGPCL